LRRKNYLTENQQLPSTAGGLNFITFFRKVMKEKDLEDPVNPVQFVFNKKRIHSLISFINY